MNHIETAIKALLLERASIVKNLESLEATLRKKREQRKTVDAALKQLGHEQASTDESKTSKPGVNRQFVSELVDSIVSERGSLTKQELVAEIESRAKASGRRLNGLSLRISEVLEERPLDGEKNPPQTCT